MAVESIGALVPTKIPGYADAADIQAALRAYHYGSYSYDTANTAPESLITPSIAKTLYDLQQADLIAATLTGSETLTNKTLTSPTVSGLYLSDSSIVIEGASANTFETTLTVTDPTQDNTITFPDASGNVVLEALSQTLTNKTLTAPIINISLNAQVGTTYTLDTPDNGKMVTFDNVDPTVVTVPTNSSEPFAVGCQIALARLGTGAVSIVGDAGVNVYGPNSNIRARYSVAALIKIDTDSWLLTGDLGVE